MRLPKGLSIIEIDSILVGKLYQTHIIELRKNENRLILRTGGWKTKHTKKCINLILNPMGLFLCQENWNWNLYQNGTLIGTFQDDTLEVVI